MCYTGAFTHIWAEHPKHSCLCHTCMALGKKKPYFCDGVLQVWISNDLLLKYPLMANIILGMWCEWLWLGDDFIVLAAVNGESSISLCPVTEKVSVKKRKAAAEAWLRNKTHKKGQLYINPKGDDVKVTRKKKRKWRLSKSKALGKNAADFQWCHQCADMTYQTKNIP